MREIMTISTRELKKTTVITTNFRVILGMMLMQQAMLNHYQEEQVMKKLQLKIKRHQNQMRVRKNLS